MKHTLQLLAVMFSLTVFSQSFVEKINSAKLNSDRELRIKLPNSYNSNPDRKYPLILVLDSEFLYAPFEGNLHYGTYWGDMPEVILVGINQNKNNERESDCDFDPRTGLPAGKGGAFFEFIGSELLPYLEKKYRVGSFKTIAGIDATAGLLNAFLYKDIPLFNAYISLSPDLQTNMEERIPKRLAQLQQPIYYYTATADGDLKKFQKQIKTLNQNMQAVKNDLINYKFDDFSNANHYSVAILGIPQALNQIFKIYEPISVKEYQEKIVILPQDYVKYLTDKYEAIEKNLGIKINVRLSDFKAIETAINKNERFEEYELLAQISGQQYEKTMMYDYHMATYWEKRGELKKAIKNYENAFVKEEIGSLTKDMMMAKAAELKQKLPSKKNKLKGGKDTSEEVTEEIPADTPTEEPKADENQEQKKDE